MATKRKQPNGKLYGIGTAMPVVNKTKTAVDLLSLLQGKVELLTKLFFERSILSPDGSEQLYFRKTLVYAGQVLKIELVSNTFFAPSVLVDARVTIAGKKNDHTYFTKHFRRFQCNSLGSFALPVTTIALQGNTYADDMILSAVVFDFSTGKLAYAEEVVI